MKKQFSFNSKAKEKKYKYESIDYKEKIIF